MSFFGFDTALPRDRSQQAQQAQQAQPRNSQQGFFSQQDAFASLSRDAAGEEKILNFEDTFDGLGDQLEEGGDDLNDDTFGGGPVTQKSVGKDFDFFGNTDKYAGTLQEEQVLHYARQPSQRQPVFHQPQKPARSGYENYAKPDYIPTLEANASIWGLPPKKAAEPQLQPQSQHHHQPQPSSSFNSRKMMSLEEVEAAMRGQGRQPSGAQNLPQQHAPVYEQHIPPQSVSTSGVPQILQRPQQPLEQEQGLPIPGATHRQQSPMYPTGTPEQHAPFQPTKILQPPAGPRQQQQQQPLSDIPGEPTGQFGHGRGPSYSGPPITQAQQMMSLPEDQRQAIMAEEAKRAKRNHKIFLLSKDNGLMTPQDKNFITRIQLQQLLTATGGVDDAGPDAQLAEDFYYQVYAQIRGAPRQHPHQPLNQFAQTYLFQTGGRYGGGRRHPRGGDNHIQRMEQQVQRAVEAAKARPKNKQLVVEGSLGKIAFSNSKTPRPLLSFKRPDSEARLQSARGASKQSVSIAIRKATLRNIENVYGVLMQMEDHERHVPPPPTEESHPDEIQRHIEWRQRAQELNQKLWFDLKVMEPIQQNPTSPHPFIAILSHSKGKKAIPRIFRHIDDQQRLTILTILAIHLDILDVIRLAYPHPEEPVLPRAVRDEIELFSQAVIPTLLAFINDAPLNIISGLLGLILDRVNVQAIIRTKIGVSMLTILISRAVLIKQSNNNAHVSEDDWAQWGQLYNRLFDLAEPVLPYIFTTENVNNSDDFQVWQFLATMGVSASPEQQQRLVLGVKDRVMQTVEVSKQLPQDMAARKLGEVNLFMRAIGLDVELLG
ncbi:hypothetical protein MBLNU459_g1896t1 [Dothideomycetes sp. NU459]